MVLPGSCKMRGSCFGATLLLVARGATGAEDVPWAKDVAKGQVVLKSFVKTGSAVVHERLRAAFGKEHIWYVGESYAVPRGVAARAGGKNFVISVVREPCGWLLGAWAWASSQGEDEGILRRCSARGGDAPSWTPLALPGDDLASPEAEAKFGDWIRAHPGVMTHWYADALNPPVDAIREPSRPGDGARHPPPPFDFCEWTADGDAARLAEAFAGGSDRAVDCWVRAATLDDDVDDCLDRAAVALDLRVDRAAYARMKRRPRDHLNSAAPGLCARYFAPLLDVVYDSERAVFDAFNYSKHECCIHADADRSEL